MSNETRRAHPRLRTLLEGRVIFNQRFSVLECTVRDLSEGGARIEFPTPFEPPAEFELEVPRRSLRVLARRVWSSGANHGVMFFKPSQHSGMAPMTQQKAQRLQTIVEDARRAIANLIDVPIDLVNLSLELPRACETSYGPDPEA